MKYSMYTWKELTLIFLHFFYSTFNRAKDGHKWDDRMEGLVQAFEYGTGAQAAGQVDACEPLRNKCFELHASTKY